MKMPLLFIIRVLHKKRRGSWALDVAHGMEWNGWQ